MLTSRVREYCSVRTQNGREKEVQKRMEMQSCKSANSKYHGSYDLKHRGCLTLWGSIVVTLQQSPLVGSVWDTKWVYLRILLVETALSKSSGILHKSKESSFLANTLTNELNYVVQHGPTRQKYGPTMGKQSLISGTIDTSNPRSKWLVNQWLNSANNHKKEVALFLYLIDF